MLRFLVGGLIVAVSAAVVTAVTVVPLWLLARGVPLFYASVIVALVVARIAYARLHRYRNAADHQDR